MNILKHYIKEIHSVEELSNGLIKVNLTVDCYGSVREIETQFPKDKWKEVKEQGYYMA